MPHRRLLVLGAIACLYGGDCAAKPRLGIASWYGYDFKGRAMANGELFDPLRLSAASRTIPLGTWIKVRNVLNGLTIIVPVLDRGPYVRGRMLDLSKAAAARLNMLTIGLALVEVEDVVPPKGR